MKKNPPRLAGYQLPTKPHVARVRQADGFFTPPQDLVPQVISIPPGRCCRLYFCRESWDRTCG